jgi:hypothetical protein
MQSSPLAPFTYVNGGVSALQINRGLIACAMQSLPLAPFTYMNSGVSALQINRVADCMCHAIRATGSIHLREWRRQRITDQPCG